MPNSSADNHSLPVSNSPDMKWWIADDDGAKGPYSTAYIKLQLKSRKLTENTQVCRVGEQRWLTIRECREFSATRPSPGDHTTAGAPPTPSTQRHTGFAKAIVTYGMVLYPILVCLNILSCPLSFLEPIDSGYDVAAVVLEGIGAVASIAMAIVLFIGATRFEQLRQNGRNWLLVGFSTNIGLNLLSIVGYLIIGVADSFSESNSSTEQPVSSLLIIIAIPLAIVYTAAFAFEAAALIFLWTRESELGLRED